jgi:hypothetical protein
VADEPVTEAGEDPASDGDEGGGLRAGVGHQGGYFSGGEGVVLHGGGKEEIAMAAKGGREEITRR